MELLQQINQGGSLINIASLIGTFASLVGLYYTFKIFLRVKNIERSYARQALLPVWIKQLKVNIRNITTFLDQKEYQKAGVEFARCSSNLDSLADQLHERHREEIKALKDEISRLSPNKTGSLNQMRSVEAKLHKLVQLAENNNKSLSWRANRDDD